MGYFLVKLLKFLDFFGEDLVLDFVSWDVKLWFFFFFVVFGVVCKL